MTPDHAQKVINAARELLANIIDAEQDKGSDGETLQDVAQLQSALAEFVLNEAPVTIEALAEKFAAKVKSADDGGFPDHGRDSIVLDFHEYRVLAKLLADVHQRSSWCHDYDFHDFKDLFCDDDEEFWTDERVSKCMSDLQDDDVDYSSIAEQVRYMVNRWKQDYDLND